MKSTLLAVVLSTLVSGLTMLDEKQGDKPQAAESVEQERERFNNHTPRV